MVSSVRSLSLILNAKTLAICAMAVLSTWLCRRYGLVADFPLTLIATAVVFPIVFSISGAYKRRESALDEYGSIKAHGRAMYFAARDWLEQSRPEVLETTGRELGELLSACRRLFAGPLHSMRDNEKAVYRQFSRLSTVIKEELRGSGLASGEVSRCNQYLSKMLVAFENIKHIYQYRTPRTLRSFSKLFISLLPPLYGPYFVYIAQDFTPSLTYVMPILFAVVLVSLDNIQEHLENPFDHVGEDDVSINADKFIASLET